MIIRIVTMYFQIDKCSDFEKIFDQKKEMIRKQKGCHHLELLRDVDEPHIYMTYSIWDSTEDLNAYRSSELFSQTWESTKALFAQRATAHSVEKIQILP